MFKLLLGIALGYLFSEMISEKVPPAKTIKESVLSISSPAAKAATIEKAGEFTPTPVVGSLLFPAGTRYPIKMIE